MADQTEPDSNAANESDGASDPIAESRSLNVPNTLSAIRLGMAFLVVALVPMEQYLAALILFVIAASTDWMDGWYARKYNQVTQLGRILDPFCDKIIICGTFIVLAVAMRDYPWYAQIGGWLAVVVTGRELLVTALRSFIESAGGDFSASMAGKLKMVFQCGAAGAALFALWHDDTNAANVPVWVVWTLAIFVWLTLISTLYSGAGYVFAAAKFIGGNNNDNNTES